MAKIRGISGMTHDQITLELNRGGKFIFFSYCIGAAFRTLRGNTDVYLVRAGQSRVRRGLPWTLLTLLLGWWAFPWGPIRTIQSLWTNLQGGTNVTPQMVGALKLTGVKWDVIGAP